MKIVTLSNYFNHHQKPLAEALYAILGDGYCFVETAEIPEFRKKLGYEEIKAPYVLKYDDHTKALIDKMIIEADVVIYGEAPLSLIKRRYNTGRLTFRDDESRYKNPNRYLKWPIYTYKSHWINKGYLLCASAYGPVDYVLSGMDPEKCFRWGYFTEVRQYESPEALLRKKSLKNPKGVSILWAGRFIGLKHPEAAIYVAGKLKNEGVVFNMNIIGSGYLEDKMKHLIKSSQLDDYVHLLGSMSPSEVRGYMEDSDIFLFTSDRCEGWGAVLNESMNSGCAVVADGNIGSVPYLINNGHNGLIYKSKNWCDLYKNIRWLIEHPSEMKKMGKNAYGTMLNLWNGETAAKNFIALCKILLENGNDSIKEGPCSKAPLIMRKWRGTIKTI